MVSVSYFAAWGVRGSAALPLQPVLQNLLPPLMIHLTLFNASTCYFACHRSSVLLFSMWICWARQPGAVIHFSWANLRFWCAFESLLQNSDGLEEPLVHGEPLVFWSRSAQLMMKQAKHMAVHQRLLSPHSSGCLRGQGGFLLGESQAGQHLMMDIPDEEVLWGGGRTRM